MTWVRGTKFWVLLCSGDFTVFLLACLSPSIKYQNNPGRRKKKVSNSGLRCRRRQSLISLTLFVCSTKSLRDLRNESRYMHLKSLLYSFISKQAESGCDWTSYWFQDELRKTYNLLSIETASTSLSIPVTGADTAVGESYGMKGDKYMVKLGLFPASVPFQA